jgi:hypothetical protein
MKKGFIITLTLITFLALSMISFPSYHVNAISYPPPIVQEVDNGISPQTNTISKTITDIGFGDTLVIGATQALRSGSPTGLGVTASGITCQNAVTNYGHTSNQITIVICPNVQVNSTTVTALSAGFCGSGAPCGFMGLWIYEIKGTITSVLNSSGTNGASTNNPTSNILSYNANSVIIGFLSDDGYSSTNTVGSGYTYAGSGCYLSGVSGAYYSCSEYKVDSSSGTENTPFTISANGDWADEAIVLNGVITFSTISFTGVICGSTCISPTNFTSSNIPVVVINGTTYYSNQLPVTFPYVIVNSNQANITQITYGYFQSTDGLNWLQTSGCGQHLKDNTINDLSNATGHAVACTVTGYYSGSTPQNSCNPICVIMSQIVAFIEFLVPSIAILMIFVFIGAKTHMSDMMQLFMLIIGLSVTCIAGSFYSGFFVPLWIGIITLIITLAGFIYSRVGSVSTT